YRIDENKNIILYSVGDNLKDDGGDSDRRNDIMISPFDPDM
ncbi:unnamed protein product, partial [marine sediment metagenome]